MSHDGNTNPGVHSGSGQASAGKEWEPESTVLVVNDAPAQVELMRLQLHQSGYRVLTAVDGEEAFEVARSARPDLIISDVVMPGVDGIELCRLIRAHPDLHATPVLLVSAVRTDSESVVEGLKVGADDYLEVPYDPLRLILKVAQIIERKRVEEALRDAEQRLQHIVASSPAVLFTLRSEDGTFQGINWISENIEAILGYRADETLGADWWMSNIHPEDRDAVVSQFHTDIFRQDYFTAEYRFRHKEDQYRWILGESRLLRDAAGQPTEIVGSLSDITERKRLEDQFQQAQKMQAIGHLAGGVAHDFSNLLTVISVSSNILLEELPPSDPMREMVTEIQQAGERAAGLTRQLLAFCRQTMLEPKVCDLNEVVRENEKMLRRLTGEDVQLTTVLAPALHPVKVEPSRIDQVIMNLVVNARDAMPTGGRVVIETGNVTLDEDAAALAQGALPGHYILLAVTDTGTGMTGEVRSHIFEPFFTTKGPGKGNGIGLATVYGIIKQSGGFISVYSEPGKGTTFNIYFPVAREGISIGYPFAARKPVPQANETILLTEDDDTVRAVLRRVLQQVGYSVLEASRGNEALRIASEHAGPIHLLITGMVMPEMSGWELAEECARLRPAIKMLFLSGYTEDAIVPHGVMQAEVAFLEKPVTTAILTNKVREVLDAA